MSWQHKIVVAHEKHSLSDFSRKSHFLTLISTTLVGYGTKLSDHMNALFRGPQNNSFSSRKWRRWVCIAKLVLNPTDDLFILWFLDSANVRGSKSGNFSMCMLLFLCLLGDFAHNILMIVSIKTEFTSFSVWAILRDKFGHC